MNRVLGSKRVRGKKNLQKQIIRTVRNPAVECQTNARRVSAPSDSGSSAAGGVLAFGARGFRAAGSTLRGADGAPATPRLLLHRLPGNEDYPSDLIDVIARLRKFLLPPLLAAREKSAFDSVWTANGKRWHS